MNRYSGFSGVSNSGLERLVSLADERSDDATVSLVGCDMDGKYVRPSVKAETIVERLQGDQKWRQ